MKKGKMQEVFSFFNEEDTSFRDLIISNATRRNSSLHLVQIKKRRVKERI